MADFISREAAIKVIQDYGKGAISDGMTALDPVDDIVSLARAMEWLDAADVAPVRHGQWLPTESPFMAECNDCSECGLRIVIGLDWDYCPSCGAKMDGGPHADHHD